MGRTRIDLINEILEIEVTMFLRVPAAEEPSCRAHMEDMKLHRRGQFSTWSEQTLESYLGDLREAQAAGRNLMTIKYARMENLVPPQSTSPHLEEIVARFVRWQEEFIGDYPAIMRRGRDLADFTNYLRSELETYSDRTLELLWTDAERCLAEGVNMSGEVYRFLAAQSGYSTLDEMEERLK